jgi:Fe-S-cluster-containing hydrogenase component 2
MSMMPAAFDFPILARDDDEGLFSRDIDGQLVRLDSPTEGDYGKSVTVQIDGKPIKVPLAEPLKDAQGNVVLDVDGSTTPRYTTIYDAAAKLYQSAGPEAKMPIPILCHQPHMRPVAVCRLCVVQIYAAKRGKRSAERKLLPACQHQVKDGMEVFTINDPGPDGERVRRVVSTLTELLSADHLKPAPAPAPAAELAPFNELQQHADHFTPNGSRFKLEVLTGSGAHVPVRSRPQLDIDPSSPVFLVDHSACILCDRCARACDDVKENNIIGRTGKGAGAGIGFDLGKPMGKSGCVQCGECMVSCPTSAITFKPVAKVKVARSGTAQVITAAELHKDPMFSDVPPKFLLWQEGLVVRRNTKKNEVLCKQGDPGNTAFLLKAGRVKVAAYPSATGVTIRKGKGKPDFEAEMAPSDGIVGEMSCLSGTPRNADLVALEDGEVWEMRRNVLDRVMRSPSMRDRVESMFRKRALDGILRNSDLFKALPPEEYKQCVEFLRPNLKFVRASPGQTLFLQGEWADNLYLLRLGHLRIAINRFGGEPSIIWLGPGTVVGEIGLLAITREDAARTPAEVDKALAETLATAEEPLGASLPAGQRTATVSALDHVEMARISRDDFLKMIKAFPTVRRRLVELSLSRLSGDSFDRPADRLFVEMGLYQAQSLLALDLDNCTRCDECTKACVDQHGTESHGAPITRLLRDGLRFGDYLVATSCRSCKDAYCMIGCPVDSIHRGKHQQIVIEDHCIGCGLCAKNCPYGNIQVEPDKKHQMTMSDAAQPGQTQMVARLKASVCDLCDSEGHLDVPLPRCVYACPHDAAHRMTGAQLMKDVMDAM